MIAESARPLVRQAVAQRLAQVGQGGAAPDPAGADDPEEALRQLMVRRLPSVGARGGEPAWRNETCVLLRSLTPSALGDDVRFFDAFNAFYERVGDAPHWHGDAGWREVQRTYARILEQVADRAAGRGWAREDLQAPPEEIPAGKGEGVAPQPGAVLVLADGVPAVARIFSALTNCGALEVHGLICNNGQQPRRKFYARQLAALLREGPGGRRALLRAWRQGQLHLRGAPLHQAETVAWLGRRRFWIGLHAMGVIYQSPVLAAFSRGVLNAHIGLLPEYRGRSVMEWSLLAGRPTGISVFFVDAGIDTGRDLVVRQEVDVTGLGDVGAAKAYLFSLDGMMYREAIRRLLQPDFVPGSNTGGYRYYVMSQLLVDVVNELLAARTAAPGWAQRCEASGRP